jgi:hypothetical protein
MNVLWLLSEWHEVKIYVASSSGFHRVWVPDNLSCVP